MVMEKRDTGTWERIRSTTEAYTVRSLCLWTERENKVRKKWTPCGDSRALLNLSSNFALSPPVKPIFRVPLAVVDMKEKCFLEGHFHQNTLLLGK